MAAKFLSLTDKEVKASLIEQLRTMGADVACFLDLIEQYMWYRREFRRLKKLTKEDPNAIKQASICTQRMTGILKELGLSTGKCVPRDDGEGLLG